MTSHKLLHVTDDVTQGQHVIDDITPGLRVTDDVTKSQDHVYEMKRFAACPTCERTDISQIMASLQQDPVMNGTFFNFGIEHELRRSLYGVCDSHIALLYNKKRNKLTLLIL